MCCGVTFKPLNYSFGIQMLHCLHLMREQKIVHCDLKPEVLLA